MANGIFDEQDEIRQENAEHAAVRTTDAHRDAARFFLCWPTNFLDLCQKDEDLPKAIEELAAFLARLDFLRDQRAQTSGVRAMKCPHCNGTGELNAPHSAGFTDANDQLCCPGDRVEYRFGKIQGTLKQVFQDGDAIVLFDDPELKHQTVKWVHLCKVPQQEN